MTPKQIEEATELLALRHTLTRMIHSARIELYAVGTDIERIRIRESEGLEELKDFLMGRLAKVEQDLIDLGVTGMHKDAEAV